MLNVVLDARALFSEGKCTIAGLPLLSPHATSIMYALLRALILYLRTYVDSHTISPEILLVYVQTQVKQLNIDNL